MNKTFLLILFLLAFTSKLSLGINLFGGCLFDSSCGSQEYCDKDLLSPIGKCVRGLPEGAACLRDKTCESKKCSFFKCKKRIAVKDGPCKQSADCPDNQYCDDIPKRSDLRQCFDRKCTGRCSKDSECLSDKCHLFTCTRGNAC